MTAISVIGLGAMGSALARTLLANGHAVTVWNRSPDKAAPLVEAGATGAESAEAAVAASPATITCIKSHDHTRALLAADPASLAGRTIIEMSTGDAADAESLVAFLAEQGADCLIGMINAYPTGIGEDDTTIITVGPQAVWDSYAPLIKTLGGKSTYVGDQPAALAALFAALFTTRQGFMFGMIYGALACKKAGVPLDLFAEQLPATIKLVHDYYDVFAKTVPSGDFADPPASMAVYAAAFEDALKTFESLEVRAEMPRLMHDLVERGVEAGRGDQQLTALVEVLADA